MRLNKNTNDNYTVRQLKLPLEIEKLIDISDPVYTFCEVMDHIDLSKYFVEKGYRTGRPRCDQQKLLKVILFTFMEHGICSLREIEKLCRNDIRYMYLLDGMKAPSFATFGNVIRNELTNTIEQIFLDVNTYIFEKDVYSYEIVPLFRRNGYRCSGQTIPLDRNRDTVNKLLCASILLA